MEPPLRILAVDDDLAILRGTCRLLEQAGYSVTSAGTGAEVLASLRASPPHLVLLDRQLGDDDGLEICRRIKADPANAGMIVIIASGHYVAEEEQVAGLETGADGYLKRPIQNAEFLARVAAFARLARGNLRLAEEIERRRQLEAGLEERVQLRTRELTQANEKLQEARRAALNLMQDATRAQQRLASANQELQGEIAERGRVEAALRRTQEQLVLAQRSAGAGMWDWEIPSGRIEWSRELFILYGLDPDRTEASFGSWTQAVHPEDRAIAGERIEKAIGAGTPLDSEYRVVRPGGEVRWVQALGNTVYDAERRPLRMSGICLDITERRRVEAALRHSEQVFRTDFEESPVGRCLVSPEGRFLMVNVALCVMLGYTASELPLLTFIDVTHPEDRAASRQGVAQLLTGHRPHLDLEKRYLTKAGQTVWGSVHVALQRTENGTPLHFSVVLQDITARKQAEAALRESEERFRMLASLAPVGVYLCDVAGHCTYVNPRWCEMAGLSPEVALGSGWVQGLYPEDRNKILAHWDQMVASEGRWALEYRFQTPDGRVTWVHGLAAAQRDASDRVVGYVGINTDITERKRHEDKIRHALAEHEVLLKEVHHRVKNNLQVVSGLLDLQAERLPDLQMRQALKESQSRIKSIALVHEKLYQSEGLARLDFKAYVQSLVAHLFHAYLGKGQVVHLDLRMAEVTLDLSAAVPCGLLINELVTNALKHAFSKGGPVGAGREVAAAGGAESRDEVLLMWEDAGTCWRLTVGDNGPGLPVGFDWERTESLGLRLVTLLARQLNGGVRLEPGHGCRFAVEFPKI